MGAFTKIPFPYFEKQQIPYFLCLPDGHETHFQGGKNADTSTRADFLERTSTEISDSGIKSFSPRCRIWTRISRTGHIFPF